MKSVYVIIVIDNLKMSYLGRISQMPSLISWRNHYRAPAEFSVISGRILLRFKRLVDPD